MSEKKVALVTGASSGIGRATAVAFAKAGAKVVLASRNTEATQQTARMIADCGGESYFVPTDVSNANHVETTIAKAVEHYGQIDYAFNNAGFAGRPAPIFEQTEAEFDQIMAVNLKGVWLCMKYEIQQMLKQGGGAIVNTSSQGGLLGMPMMSIYGASKHGVLGLTKSAALEFAKANIRVNAVCPSLIDNTVMINQAKQIAPEMFQYMVNAHPIGRAGQPEEVANAVVWLCSQEASFVTGIALPIDGGTVAA